MIIKVLNDGSYTQLIGYPFKLLINVIDPSSIDCKPAECLYFLVSLVTHYNIIFNIYIN